MFLSKDVAFVDTMKAQRASTNPRHNFLAATPRRVEIGVGSGRRESIPDANARCFSVDMVDIYETKRHLKRSFCPVFHEHPVGWSVGGI